VSDHPHGTSAHPRITVVTPSFRQAPFLEQAIRSVLDQGYPNLEYIVLDGGSEDGSVDIIRKYEGRLAYWRHAPDGGQGAAVVEGWRMATGDLVTWLNSDDVLLRGALETVAKAYSPRHQIYYGDLLCFDDSGRVTKYVLHEGSSSAIARRGLFFPAQPGTFLTRELVEKVGYFDTKLRCAMEYDLMLRMYNAGARLKNLKRPMAALRFYPGTKSSTLRDVMVRELYQQLERHVGRPWSTPAVWRAAWQVLRVVRLSRYINPLSFRRVAERGRIRRSRIPIDEYLPRKEMT
jgi:glycosyltransferase involved in cell wall biosynthesis